MQFIYNLSVVLYFVLQHFQYLGLHNVWQCNCSLIQYLGINVIYFWRIYLLINFVSQSPNALTKDM